MENKCGTCHFWNEYQDIQLAWMSDGLKKKIGDCKTPLHHLASDQPERLVRRLEGIACGT